MAKSVDTGKSFLVTGGAGYIGSILVPELLSLGHRVTVVDSFMYGQTALLNSCLNENLKIIRGDARDKDLIGRHISEADVIFPLACLVGAPLCKQKPLEGKSTNYDAIKLILDLKSKDQQVIFPTTNSGYGVGEKGKFCDETSPLNPVSLYGQWKNEIEQELLSNENTVTLRLATVFGASSRMRLDLLVNDFTYRAVTDKFLVLFQAQFMRNYIHVRDVSSAFIHTVDNFEKMKGEPYNVGLTEANLSKWDLCERIKKQVPDFYFNEAEIGEDPDKRDYIVSNDKIEATGFKPKVSLDQGIRELINAYQVVRRNQYSNI